MEPTLEEQRLIIRGFLAEKPSIMEEDGAFLLSTWWSDLWRDAVGWTTHVPNEDAIVPAIDNSGLFDDSGSLKNDLRLEEDYLIVSGPIWQWLLKWYGGGPEFVVPFVNGEAAREFRCIPFNYKGEEMTGLLHNLMTTSDILGHVRDAYHIPESDEIRLVVCKGETQKSVWNIFVFAELKNWDWLYVDYKNEDGLWQTGLPDQDLDIFSLDNSSDDSDVGFLSARTLGPGLAGFPNLGNTCFFNSAVQCLMHTKMLMNFFLHEDWEKDLNYTNAIGMKGDLARAFAKLAVAVWTDNQYDSTIRGDISMLREVIGRFAPQFSGFHQQDSHELMTFMLDGIHEDLNRCHTKPVVEAVEGDGTNDREIAAESWKRYKSRNDSIIVDIFHGQMRSVLVCPNCHQKTVVFDPYMSLPLPIRKESSQQISVVFVPYDINKPSRVVSIASTSSDFSQTVSNALGETVSVVPLTCTIYRNMDYGYRFGLEHSVSDVVLYAVELPDTEKKYVIGRIMGDAHDESGPIAVEVGEFPVSLSDLEGLFYERLKPIIGELSQNNTDHEYDDPDMQLLSASLSGNGRESWKWTDDKKLGVLKSYYSPSVEPLNGGYTSDTRRVGQKVVLVKVNPAYVDHHCVCGVSELKQRMGTPDTGETPSKHVDLYDCFRYFAQREVLDEKNQWRCSKCEQFVCAEKKMDVWSVPDVLILQLKRFVVEPGDISRKFEDEISFPDELDVSPYVCGPPTGKSLKYRLYAVSEHIGGLFGGHYIAHAKVCTGNSDQGQWYEFNDSAVSRSSRSEAHSDRAYLLFYERQ